MRRSAALGERAERDVEAHLVREGFAILAKNLRLGALEIDLVARKESLVVIVEVRARGPGSFVGPLASITPTKRTRLLRAADRLWREQLEKMRDVERVRIDVAGVTYENDHARIDYIPGAVVRGA